MFEVSPLLLIHQHEVEVVANTELVVNVPHRGCEVIAYQEQTDGDGLPPHWGTIHDLILAHLLVLSVDIRSCVYVWGQLNTIIIVLLLQCLQPRE